jgi:hypothetical protein
MALFMSLATPQPGNFMQLSQKFVVSTAVGICVMSLISGGANAQDQTAKKSAIPVLESFKTCDLKSMSKAPICDFSQLMRL